nr:palindromic element RPE1 domain-containing protein [Rickettsia monacensis]
MQQTSYIANKEEFEGNTEHSTAAYTLVRRMRVKD